MASNYKDSGVDFDDLFEARVSTKRADVGYDVAGVDISNRYEPLARDQRIPWGKYESIGTNLSDMFMGNVSQYATTTRLTSTRTSAWNTQIIHDVRLTFSSQTARNNYFWFGGRVQWNSSRTGGSSTQKNTDWTNLLSSMGTIELARSETYKNYSTTISGVGYLDLTATWQTIVSQSGTGAYTTNNVTIQAHLPNSTQVRMRIIYTDGASGTIDESVDGTITSNILERRYPTAESPAWANITLLTAGS